MDIQLSDAERTFIIHGMQQNLRNDGRSCQDYRPIMIETDVVNNTSGSARVRLGHTDVLVGIKAEIETPTVENPDCGWISFFVDCSANAAPEFEGKGGDDIAQDISSAMTMAYANANVVDLKKLSIVRGKFCWTLYIDVVLLECGGSMYDATSFAVKAALFNLSIPNVTVSYDENKEPDIEITEDPHDCWKFDSSNCPVMITVNKIGTSNVIDTTLEEETCILSRLLVAANTSKKITMMRQEGHGSLDPDSMADMAQLGLEVAVNVHKSLDAKLIEDSKTAKKETHGFL